MSDPTLRTGSVGEETAAEVYADIPDESFDLVIMNPPFTRATNHGGVHANVVNPAVAAFDASAADQKAMGQRINEMGKKSCYHGNAGIASAFAALAHRKLKPGGVLALVLPLVASTGLSWQKFRQMLARGYTEVTVLSIAASNINDLIVSRRIRVWENVWLSPVSSGQVRNRLNECTLPRCANVHRGLPTPARSPAMWHRPTASGRSRTVPTAVHR